MNNRGKKLISDVLMFAISNFGSKILVLLLVPIYTNIMTTKEYGIADLFTVTINILFPLLTLSITEATLRFLLDKNSNKGQILGVSFLFVGISFVLLVCVSPFVAYQYGAIWPYWGLFLLLYLVTSLSTCFSNYTRGVDKTRVFAVKGIIYTIAVLVLNILFLVVFKWGLYGYLLSAIFSEIITIIYMVVRADIYKSFRNLSLDKRLIKEMLNYSLPMIPTSLAWWVMQMSDKYIIIAFSGLAVSGIYSVSYKIPSILSVISTIFNQAWQISSVKSMEDKDYSEFFRKVYIIYFASCVMLCGGLIALSKGLGSILFAKDYFVAWKYVPFLLVAYFFSGLSGVMASVYTTKKKTSILLYSTVMGASLNLVLNIAFIPKYGAIAAAITTMIGFVVTFIIREICMRKYFNMPMNSFREVISIFLLVIESIVVTLEGQHAYYTSIAIIIINLMLYKTTIISLIKMSCSFFKTFYLKIMN